jgi:hypothetical protein
MQPDVGQSAPVTPPMISMQLPPTPRRPHTTRAHEGEPNVEQETKSRKAKTEQQKKQRLNQIMLFNESMI